VRRYQLHLGSSAVGVPIIDQSISTLRFFFNITLRRHDIVEHTHIIQEPRRLPVMLSVEEWRGCSMPPGAQILARRWPA
jgi:integrase/recombinase XerD